LRQWGKDGPLAAERVIEAAFENGIRLFETARWYGDNEARIGTALRGRCSECYFVSKTLRRDADGTLADVDESLRALHIDHIDVYMVHHVQWEEELQAVLSPGGALEGLRQAQAEGKIGFIGVAGHRTELLCNALATGEFDTVEVPCNVFDPWIFRTVLPVAQRFDVGIIAMKALAGGKLSQHAVTALRFALGQSYDSLVVGMSTVEQVQVNIAETVLFDQMSEAGQKRLVEEASHLGDHLCRLECGNRCMSRCPHHVQIADILRLKRYHAVYKSGHWAKAEYRRLGLPAEVCSACSGYCGEACLFELPVREMLQSAHDALSAPITDYEIAQHGGEDAIAKEVAQ
jgi:predicted aldo/keto reductase-like oxidoreductase